MNKLAVSIQYLNGIMTAKLSGELDDHTTQEIRKNIDAQVEKRHPTILRLDFSHITFMDSSGIGLIMGRYRIIKFLGGELQIVNVPLRIMKILEISGMRALGIDIKGVGKND